MAITPGDDIETKTGEPLPRGNWLDRTGNITRAVMNYFNGKDRLAGEIVSGVNRNRANIVQLQTDYQDADGAVASAYIAADAVVAANAAGARATLESELTAAYEADDATTLASAQSYTDVEVTAEGVARASADTTVLATTRSESQRPNLVPEDQQFLLYGHDPAITDDIEIFGAAWDTSTQASTFLFGTDPETGSPFYPVKAYRGSSGTITARPRRDHSRTMMFLEPGRYAYRAAVIGFSNATSHTFRIRDAAASIKFTETHTASLGAQRIEGYFDVESSWSGPFVWEVQTAVSAAGSIWYERIQVTRIPDGTTDTGDWTGTMDSRTAMSRILQDAFIGSDGTAIAKLVLEASAGGGNPARIGLRDGSGGSSIALVAEQIFFGDDTVFEDTYNTIYVESGGYRLRILGPFPASGDLVIWYGADSVALNSETKTNGIFALATDGKVYFGANDLSNEVGGMSLAMTGGFYSGASGSGKLTGDLNCTATNTTGTVSYLWTCSDPAVSFTAPTSATTQAQRDITGSVTAVARCLVTDSSGSKEGSAQARWTVI